MRFSIIIPYYQGCTSEKEFERCIKSIVEQSFKDFEVLIYHDGALLRDIPNSTLNLIKNLKGKFLVVKRYDDWGHSLRDMGIREATGDYIIHLNADNILFNVLKELDEEIGKTNKPIYILPLRMRGLYTKRGKEKLLVAKEPMEGFMEGEFILRGIPKFQKIDCMQLVMKRSLWLSHGGWIDKTRDSDGLMYERFCKEHEYKLLGAKYLIGEHW